MGDIWNISPEFSLGLILLTTSLCLLPVALLLFAVRNYVNESKKRWWKNNVIYHIYPRSFQDSNGDGNGDLNGITSRLEYFDYLGVKILYLSPIFASPMADNGYDISDFKSINPLFGSMEDFEALLRAVHARGMKLLLDFVPNHTSIQHQWFLESRQSRDDPKRDWYIWKDPSLDGGPPNNWVSVFGGRAWTFDAKTKQYYLHQFYKEQPDLNFRNPDVREAMTDILGFWLDKGVDGFRVDAVPHLFKDEEFRDEPVLPNYDQDNPRHADLDHKFTFNLDQVHEVVREWRTFCDRYNNPYRLLIGEVMADIEFAMSYYGNNGQEFDFPFNFTLLGLKKGTSAYEIHRQVDYYLNALPKGAWPNWLLSNHDVKRIGTRIGEEYIPAVTAMYLTLPGTAIMYYGDELGYTDANIPPKKLKDFCDPCRTPMQWSGGRNAGFSKAKNTWLPLTGNKEEEKNVVVQQVNPTSNLRLTQQILMLRNSEAAFHGLNLHIVHVDKHAFAYIRSHRRSKFLIVMNFGPKIWCGTLNSIHGYGSVVIDSSNIKEKGSYINLNRLILHPGQVLIVKKH